MVLVSVYTLLRWLPWDFEPMLSHLCGRFLAALRLKLKSASQNQSLSLEHCVLFSSEFVAGQR